MAETARSKKQRSVRRNNREGHAIGTGLWVYADENIEDGAVEWLRARGVNMKSARELGHRGKPDSFHAALVFKQRRFLLTKNGKHFLDDQKLPFHRTYGVIALSTDFRDIKQYLKALASLFGIVVPFGGFYSKFKITVSADTFVLRRIAPKGRMHAARYRVDDKYAYEWVDDGAD